MIGAGEAPKILAGEAGRSFGAEALPAPAGGPKSGAEALPASPCGRRRSRAAALRARVTLRAPKVKGCCVAALCPAFACGAALDA